MPPSQQSPAAPTLLLGEAYQAGLELAAPGFSDAMPYTMEEIECHEAWLSRVLGNGQPPSSPPRLTERHSTMLGMTSMQALGVDNVQGPGSMQVSEIVLHQANMPVMDPSAVG